MSLSIEKFFLFSLFILKNFPCYYIIYNYVYVTQSPKFVDLEEFDEPLEYDPFISKKKIKKNM